MAAEIERKYLVLDDSWRKNASIGSVFCQTYLMARKSRFVRIRIIDNARAFLAIKFRTSALRREEFEYEIPYLDALEMASHSTALVEKTRYEVDCCGYCWQIDVYNGPYEGLVIAEIELENESVRNPHPPWLGKEITGDPNYSNRAMAAATSMSRSANARVTPDAQIFGVNELV
ncbi:CYTH domain-containing protein [Rhizobium sp. KVB221]|uniref:CYTH domain-containing protein n=1 Tax=Rhizobium setariae TaxID=2801340 RepID=A0A937CQF4_9HYPH|nr:CYTH domain-containing protein [Rhizobium setariae]MBL0372937.1 CYTH domain-containing protein [Rhizobium setariae]